MKYAFISTLQKPILIPKPTFLIPKSFLLPKTSSPNPSDIGSGMQAAAAVGCERTTAAVAGSRHEERHRGRDAGAGRWDAVRMQELGVGEAEVAAATRPAGGARCW